MRNILKLIFTLSDKFTMRNTYIYIYTNFYSIL